MPQVRKLCPYGISAILFQCFMIETQVLMTESDFSGFFLGIISWKGASLFSGGGCCFSDGRASFLIGWVPHGGYWFWWEGGSKKKGAWGRTLHHHHHHHGKSCIKRDNMSMDFIRKSIWIMIYQIGLPKVYFKVNYIWLSLK